MKNFDNEHFNRLNTYEQSIYQLYLKMLRDVARLLTTIQIDPVKPFNFNDYPAIRNRVDSLFQELSSKVQFKIERASTYEWLQANLKNDVLLNDLVKGSNLTEAQKKIYYNRNREGLQSFLKRKADGLNLSDRVWLYTNQYKNEIEMAIDVAISNKVSAQELSQTVRQYLQQPETLFRRVRDKNGVLHLSKKAAAYHPGRGVYRSSYKNAMRLAGTEINIAYRTADHVRMQQLPFIKGFRVVTSNNHPVRDICDDLKGEYPKEFLFKGWHPHCRCHVETIMVSDKEYNDIEDRLLAGEDISDYKSPTAVKSVPKGLKDWVKNNKDRGSKWKSQPYFIRDNFEGGRIEGGLLKNLNTSNIVQNPNIYEQLNDVENEIRINRFETLVTIDSNGNEVLRKAGGERSVELTDEEMLLLNNNIVTHNHPGGWDYPETSINRIGNSFSPSDIAVAINGNVSEIRAVTPNYTFAIERPESGWISLDEFKKSFTSINEEVRNKNYELINMTNAEVSIERAKITHYHEVWKRFSKKHNIKYTKKKTA